MNNDLGSFLKHLQLCQIELRNAKLGNEYYYASLPLCAIDAVFSIGVRYTSTQNTIKRWCERYQWQQFRDNSNVLSEHSIDNFLKIIEGREYTEIADNDFKNRQLTSTTGGILKAEAVYKFAKILQKYEIQRLGDTYSTVYTEKATQVEREIKEIAGQGSGISFSYFLMLAGNDNLVKSDRMLMRFVGEALGKEMLRAEEIQALFTMACKELKSEYPNITPRLLDYKVWEYQRSINKADCLR